MDATPKDTSININEFTTQITLIQNNEYLDLTSDFWEFVCRNNSVDNGELECSFRAYFKKNVLDAVREVVKLLLFLQHDMCNSLHFFEERGG